MEATSQKPEHGMLFDIRRKAQLAHAGPNDHEGQIVVKAMDLEWEKSIFKTLDPAMRPMVRDQFGKEIFWSEKAVSEVEQKTAELLATNKSWSSLKAHSPALIDFMKNECDFNTEHADGSFLEHLQYCYEFGAAHMPNHSAVPLFLHSIMGVGTNLFPMQLEQRSRLSELVTADELAHIEAFPSVLRLLQSGALIRKLESMSQEELDAIDELEYCRLLGPDMNNNMKSDNAVCKLTGEQLWVHLNYHLIHFIDFLPVEQWKANVSQMRTFSDLHRLLKRTGKLMCEMNFDSETWSPEAAKAMDEELQGGMSTHFSDLIGHSHEFKVTVGDAVAAPRSRL